MKIENEFKNTTTIKHGLRNFNFKLGSKMKAYLKGVFANNNGGILKCIIYKTNKKYYEILILFECDKK